MGESKRRSASGEPRHKASKIRRRRWLAGAAVGLVLAVAAGLLFVLTSPTISPLDDLPKAAAGQPPFPAEFDRYGVSLGDPNAPVVVREFADYQCPSCAHFSAMAERLKDDYIEPGKVRLVYFDFPLQQHKHAMVAAQAARCAGDQEAYWPMHTLLFEGQSRWAGTENPSGFFSGYARELKLDEALFQRCLSSERHRGAVEQSLRVAQQLRVVSTPTVYVDNVLLTRPGWYQLAGVVENQLKGEAAE